MDPDATLANLRSAYSEYEDTRGNGGSEATDGMRDAAVALDEWLSSGGFLPSDWQR